jgi:ubiquinone/menaquinone biosynthesis C-methylase UbiE
MGINEKETTGSMHMYESALFKGLTGGVIRPGGFAITQAAMEWCAFAQDARLLDIGCGRGVTAEFIQAQYGNHCIGIDCSRMLVREGLERNKALELLHGTAEALPFEDGSMDGVLTECSFSLIQDKEKALYEIKRVLKNSGKWILSDMYLRSAEKSLPNDARPVSCIGNAFILEELYALLFEKGFRMLHFEDHTRALKELMANILLEHGSLETFFQLTTGNACNLADAEGRKQKIGYFLLIAQKE